ncbi:MAG: methylated-DNA--[protein]-cysteine S-methyltransferase [Bacteroidetes bacterium]|nr:methylated-DNA--[protein]-cysteine S-methyltransferase [Bacteroidota bacterium]
MTISPAAMYRALVRKDASYEGTFYAAVKTTGIFCRPTCTARKPKRENVEFFPHAADALRHGYRPCKVCSPMTAAGEEPGEIRTLLQRITDDPSAKIGDADLRRLQLDPARVRRWFKKHHGITFQSYQRMLRINAAYRKLTDGGSVTDAAFDSGFGSLSGFSGAFRSLVGTAPSAGPGAAVVTMTRFTTPLGPMFAAATEKGLCLLEFTDRRMLETELKMVRKRYNAAILAGTNTVLEHVKREMQEYFEGKRTVFSVPLDRRGTEFQLAVWKQLERIPYGTTVSYQTQAERVKRPTAVRAVANANGNNFISIIVPCHRVIGSDGTLTGYGGGLWRKQWLLDHEKSVSRRKR